MRCPAYYGFFITCLEEMLNPDEFSIKEDMDPSVLINV
jgi:hypothetical protein